MKTTIALVLAAVLAAACDTDIPDLNNPSLDDLLEAPTAAEVNSAATGLLIGARRDFPNPNGYVAMLGILGREAYNFDAADARFITEMLAAPLSAGSPAFGGNFWVNPYRNIRTAVLVLNAVDIIDPALYSEEDRQAVRGFAKTIRAYNYLELLSTRDVIGAVIVLSLDIKTLDPLVSKTAIQDYIATQLDEAKAHLMAAGDTFPFPLSTGFAGFNTPENFIKFNRALKARIEAYRGNHQLILDALAESFITADADDPQLDLGVYHAFGTGSGDTLNGLNSPNLFVHPSITTGAEAGDDRLARKTRSVTSRTVQGLTSDKGFTAYLSVTAPIPYIRNEELILLRAEANIGLGNLAAATDDLNFIRAASGGLDPIAVPGNADDAITRLLYERTYSLLFEGGHRWIDYRRFGRLDQLPLDKPEHLRHSAFPIPTNETNAR